MLVWDAALEEGGRRGEALGGNLISSENLLRLQGWVGLPFSSPRAFLSTHASRGFICLSSVSPSTCEFQDGGSGIVPVTTVFPNTVSGGYEVLNHYINMFQYMFTKPLIWARDSVLLGACVGAGLSMVTKSELMTPWSL